MTEANITVEDVQIQNYTKPVKLLKISGQLDESNVDEKAQIVYEVLTKTPDTSLIMDLENLDYMNSKSIGYLTDWYGKVSGSNGKMAILKAKPNINDVLEVVGLTQLIPVFQSVEEAKFFISGAEGGAAK